MNPTLFILSAGMGFRNGGLKHLDGVGPNNETIMDYSVYDAIRAGFGKVVFVIRKEFEKEFTERIISKYINQIEIDVVFQSMDSLPVGYKVPEGRRVRWGTNHAIMMGKEVIKEPFAVINADDFYGKDSFKLLADELIKMQSTTNNYCMVGYKVGNTLSDNGTVARGICSVDSNGYLTNIVERREVLVIADTISYKNENDIWISINKETPVSMNMWGFTPDYFIHSTALFNEFLKINGADKKAQFLIPDVVSALLTRKYATVKVLHTPSKWFGVTYSSDRAAVVARIKELIEAGEYPQKLW